jgi:hypothetical protein
MVSVLEREQNSPQQLEPTSAPNQNAIKVARFQLRNLAKRRPAVARSVDSLAIKVAYVWL